MNAHGPEFRYHFGTDGDVRQEVVAMSPATPSGPGRDRPDVTPPGPPPMPGECLKLSVTLRFARNEVLVPIGKRSPGLYYLTRGTVRIVRLSEQAERRTLCLVPPRRFIYETRFLADMPLSLQAEALEPIMTAFFHRDLALRLVNEHPAFRSLVFFSIAEKMEAFGRELLQCAYTGNTERLLQLLRDMAESGGEGPEHTIRVSQEELGEMLGLHRVTVNRLLRRLESMGVVTLGRNRVRLRE